MPKYIKLFENFISEAAPFPFDPAKTALKGAKLHSDGLYYAIFPEGRIYIPTKETESLKKLPTNIMVTLNKRATDLEKALIGLGGKLDQKSTGTKDEPGGGKYSHFSTIHFNLTDPAAGDSTLVKISQILSGTYAASSGTSGTAGTAGTAGKTGRNLTDELFGKGIADLFRANIADVTGKPYDAAKSIPAYQQAKIAAADKKLKDENPEYFELSKKIEDVAKAAKIVDFEKGTSKDGKVNQEYLDLRQKINAILASAI